MRPTHLFITSCLLVTITPALLAEYDPSAIPDGFESKTVDLVVRDESRDREVPILVHLPTVTEPAPVVLFSHGLGGSREGGAAYLGRHWAARGYVVVMLQHPGSDDAVWRDAPLLQRMAAMRRAASAENFLHRVRDVPAVLDQLSEWNGRDGHALAGRLDLAKVGMSGHSFGALTTQAVGGQALGRRMPFTDERIKAAVALSPSAPTVGTADRAFGKVAIPWLLMTGTKDTAPIGGQTVESRLAVFPALPTGNKYELVLDRAEHSAFSDRLLPGDRETRNPNHHRAVLAISTAFWDTHLRRDDAARTWLDGEGPRSVIEKADRWQKK